VNLLRKLILKMSSRRDKSEDLPSSEAARQAVFCDKCDDLLEGGLYHCLDCGKKFHYECIVHDISGLRCPLCSGKLEKLNTLRLR